MMTKTLFGAVLGAAALTSTAALAHDGVHAVGFAAGFAHPFSGLDHLLAMTGLGLWAAGTDSRGRWLLPALFVAGMAAGGVLALSGVALPGVELGIAGSVVAIGLLIAAGQRLPLAAAGGIAVLAALFHGHAHGTEMAGAAAAAGALLATAALHGAGVGLGMAATHPRLVRVLRGAGALIAALGAGLLATA
jgi:urease accessory protein